MTDDPSRINLDYERDNRSPFQELMGYRLESWSPDYAALTYEILPQHLNRTGRLHGGVLASLLDTAAGFAGCYCATPGEKRTTVTLTLSVNFVAAASAGTLLIESRRTGGGRSVFFADATVKDAEGRLIATGSGSFKYLNDRTKAPDAG